MIRALLRIARFLVRRLVVWIVNLLAVPPETPVFHPLRCALMRCIGTEIGRGTELSEHLYIFDGRNFRLGAQARLGSFCRIWDFTPIIIGDRLLASQGLTLISGTHLLDIERTSKPGPITIGHNVWIGINVTIVGPASVGDHVIIGANSLVMGTLESNCVYAGTPARLIRRLDAPSPSEV